MIQVNLLARRPLALACLIGIGALTTIPAQAADAPSAQPPIVVVPAAEDTAAGEALVARAGEQGQVRVIVGLTETLADESLAPAAAQTQRARLRAAQNALLADIGAGAASGQARTQAEGQEAASTE